MSLNTMERCYPRLSHYRKAIRRSGRYPGGWMASRNTRPWNQTRYLHSHCVCDTALSRPLDRSGYPPSADWAVPSSDTASGGGLGWNCHRWAWSPLGEPGVPVICWAVAGMIPSRAKPVDVRSKRRDWFIVTPYTLRGVINITASVCSPPCDNPHVMSAKGQERTSRPASRMSAKCHKQTGTSLMYRVGARPIPVSKSASAKDRRLGRGDHDAPPRSWSIRSYRAPLEAASAALLSCQAPPIHSGHHDIGKQEVDTKLIFSQQLKCDCRIRSGEHAVVQISQGIG